MKIPTSGQEVKESLSSRTNEGPADDKTGDPSLEMPHIIKGGSGVHRTALPWSTRKEFAPRDPNSPQFVERKVRALLNKLTAERFDSISKQILEWANRSVNEVDGRTLIQVIRLIFERATDEETWSEIYARLCQFLMEHISQDVRDEGIKDFDGNPVAGRNLFRKHLLNHCQEDFERGWSAREGMIVSTPSTAQDFEVVVAEVMYSDGYRAYQKARRRGLGLMKFIGELFKLQMMTERIIHECIKKLLSKVEGPEEEEIESLCKLLATVGHTLDTRKARNHVDVYFGRMQELANSGQIRSRIQYMLIDIIELRTRNWVPRTQVASPTTIAELHQKAERGRQVSPRRAHGRGRVRGGRRDTRDYGPPQVSADGWTTSAVRPPTKAGDFSNLGKISKSTTMHFGPSSVFSRKERRESGSSVTPVSFSSDMFAALNSGEATRQTRVPFQSQSFLAGFSTSAAGSASADMSLEQAKRKIKEDLKELFMLRQLSEAEGYFSTLPAEFRWYLVEQLVHRAVDARVADVQLISDVFDLVASKSLIDEEQFSRGFADDMEYLEDTSTDSPNAYGNVASLLRASKLSQAAVERLADKIIVEGDMAVTPREKLLKKYAALMT